MKLKLLFKYSTSRYILFQNTFYFVNNLKFYKLTSNERICSSIYIDFPSPSTLSGSEKVLIQNWPFYWSWFFLSFWKQIRIYQLCFTFSFTLYVNSDVPDDMLQCFYLVKDTSTSPFLLCKTFSFSPSTPAHMKNGDFKAQ